jgi:hypothetical protein
MRDAAISDVPWHTPKTTSLRVAQRSWYHPRDLGLANQPNLAQRSTAMQRSLGSLAAPSSDPQQSPLPRTGCLDADVMSIWLTPLYTPSAFRTFVTLSRTNELFSSFCRSSYERGARERTGMQAVPWPQAIDGIDQRVRP